MKKIKKKWIVLIVLALLLVGFFVVNGMTAGKNALKPVEVSSITQGDIETLVEVTGNVEANDSAEITSVYNYKVTAINVKEGDIVKKDQVLATLDSSDLKDEIALLEKEAAYEQLRLNEAYNEVNNIYTSTDSLQMNVESSKLSNDNAKITFNDAVENLKKQEELFAAGAIAGQELENAQKSKEQAQIALEQSEIAYKQAQEALEKGKHDVQNAVNQATPKASAKASLDLKLASLAQKREKLEDLNIKSPIAGTVTRVYARVGRTAKETENNQPMFIIEDESKKFLVAKVGEYDISTVKLDQEVTITADVLGNDTAKGTVSRISPTGEKSQTGTSIVVPVKILITKSDARLITGVSAKAKIKTDSMKNILKTSFENIYTEGDKNYVFVVDNDTVKKIEVKTGISSTFETQVISPEIKANMQVVKSPDETLIDGEKVMISNATQPTDGDQKAGEEKKEDTTK